MTRTRRILLAGAVAAAAHIAAFALPEAAQTPVTVLRFARVWDGERLLANATIVVEGDRIVSVGTSKVVAPPGAVTIDLTRFTALPGLIDLHTHMTYSWDRAPGTTPRNQPRREPAETARLAGENARRTLETGVTTVRDLGAGNGTDVMMRDRIAAGDLIGPRMFVAGQGISAGRGGTPDPEAMRRTTELRLAVNADWVKVYGSRGSYQSVDTTQTVTFDEMKAIVDTAHAKGRKVAIHSYGASGVKDAVRAGADSVEHGIDLDADTLTDMARRGTVWVPTIDHNRYYVDAKEEFAFAADTIPPLLAYIEKNLDATRRAVKAGVKIGMGSDAVYSMFGQNTRELGWFVKAGMTPAQALATATTTAAELLGVGGRLGVLRRGYLADIVAVEGNPLERLDALFTGVRWVMKDGKVVVDRR